MRLTNYWVWFTEQCARRIPVFCLRYTSLVRPVLEYGAPAWNPYLAKDVLALERT